MRNAPTNQPAPSPGASEPQDGEQRERPAEQVSDLAIASAVAQVARQVPGVVDSSAGRVALAATYGAGQRVTGVVVRHLAQDQIILEIHVILSEAYCVMALSEPAQELAGFAANGSGLLNAMADRIRGAVHDAMQGTLSMTLVGVDVYIDDLR